MTTTDQTPDEVDVAIIGAGIGGLAAAVALRRAGVDAHVFERTAVLREIGGAVVIREPALRLLTQWGLEGGFREQAVRVDVIEKRDADGTLDRILPADFTGDGEAYSAHRADVHGLLLSGVPAGRVHLGVTTTEVVNDGDRAVARFADGSRVAARLVIGADGIRSVARRAVVHDEPVFARLTVLRGLAPASALGEGLRNDRMTMWGEGGLIMLVLPLRGGEVVALDTAVTADEPPPDLWSSEVPRQDLLDAFAGFDPRLLDLITAGSPAVSTHPVYEREPIPTWATGRITLLGDAAHPMAPRQGQGANQAILDAGVLADALAATGLTEPTPALERYQSIRVGPATAMQLASRRAPVLTDVSHP